MRTRTDPPGPRDCLGLRHAEAVLSLVPRLALDVQLERDEGLNYFEYIVLAMLSGKWLRE